MMYERVYGSMNLDTRSKLKMTSALVAEVISFRLIMVGTLLLQLLDYNVKIFLNRYLSQDHRNNYLRCKNPFLPIEKVFLALGWGNNLVRLRKVFQARHDENRHNEHSEKLKCCNDCNVSFYSGGDEAHLI